MENVDGAGGARESSAQAEKRQLGRSGARALTILELFGARRSAMRAIDVVSATGWAASSVDQLMKSLVSSGFMLFDQRSKLYYPSPRLLPFSSWLQQEAFGSCRLVDIVERLFSETGQFSTITSQNDCFMQVVACSGPKEWHDDHRYEAKISLVESVSGRAMIAQHDDPTVRYFAHRARYLAGSRLSEQQALVSAQRTRALGYAAGDARGYGQSLCPPAIRSKLWAVAMDIPRDMTGGRSLILGIGGSADALAGNEHALADIMSGVLRAARSEMIH